MVVGITGNMLLLNPYRLNNKEDLIFMQTTPKPAERLPAHGIGAGKRLRGGMVTRTWTTKDIFLLISTRCRYASCDPSLL